MIKTGRASAVTVGGVQMIPLGEYTLKIAQESEDYEVLSSSFKQRIPTFKNWELELKLKAALPARSYGTVTAGSWTGIYLNSWKTSIKAQVDEALQQANEWSDKVVSGLDWSVESSKYVDSATNHVFLQAVAAGDGNVVVRTPLLQGYCVYGDTETTADAKPKEEKLNFDGNGPFTIGSYFTDITNKLLAYGTQLQSQSYVQPEAITVLNLLSGLGYVSEFTADSDGKVVDLSVKLVGHGEPTLL